MVKHIADENRGRVMLYFEGGGIDSYVSKRAQYTTVCWHFTTGLLEVGGLEW